MKILVLNPPFKSEYGKFSRASRSPAVTKGGTVYYPIWLSYAVGVLDKAGFEIKFIDAPAQRCSLKKVFKKLGDFVPKLIILDTSTPSIKSDVATAQALKKRFADAFVVLVGTHPSALPEETLRMSHLINAVAIGEYEYTLRELAEAIETKNSFDKIPGLVFRKGKRIVVNPPRPVIKNIDDLPLVASVYKKYLNIKDYYFAAANYPVIQIMTARGCPFRCFFCVYPQVFHRRRYRSRSAENVVAEFGYVKKNFPEVKEMGLEDDTLTIDIPRVRKICRLLTEKSNKLPWYANIRADVDLATLKLMRKAGCRLITVGFESADQKILNRIKKGITVQQIRKFVANCKKAGIKIHGCFMAGNPGETKETLRNNLKLAKELNCDLMQFFPLLVYPGTEAYQWAQKKGFLKTEDFSEWSTKGGNYNCVIDLPGLPGKELVAICNEQYKKYLFRPGYVISQLLKPSEYMRNLRGLINFLSLMIREGF